MDHTILATIRKYLDDAGHAIRDKDDQAAINTLADAKEAITTLQGIMRLPEHCRGEIWT